MHNIRPDRSVVLLCLSFVASLLVFVWFIGQFFPNPNGHLGHDYSLFLPWLLSGKYLQTVNGLFFSAAFTPSFCGGIPLLFNPQSIYYSLPQILAIVTGPVEAFYLTTVMFGLIGCGSMFLLARRFRASVATSLVAASIFMLNGFFIYRMVIGHVTYHSVMLVPLIALLLLAEPARSGRKRIQHIALAALIVAYFFYSGAINVILPSALAVTMLWALYRILGHPAPYFIRDSIIAALLGSALAAYKLVPAFFFAENVTRPTELQLIDELFQLVGRLGTGLFAPQFLTFLPDDGRIWRHESEYGVGLAPLLAVLSATIFALRNGDLVSWWNKRHVRSSTAWLAVMALLLALPVLINYSAPNMRGFILSVPVLKMMSLLVRFWFAYIPLLCILTALSLDYLVRHHRSRKLVCALSMAITSLQLLATNTDYYLTQGYDPGLIIAGNQRLVEDKPIPPISWIGDPLESKAVDSDMFTGQENDSLVMGISPIPCYEPMFGYHMESFPAPDLEDGHALEISEEALRLRNPVCYVFPEANKCRPGDGFRIENASSALAFSRYENFPYRHPWWMKAARNLTIIAIFITVAGLLAGSRFFRKEITP